MTNSGSAPGQIYVIMRLLNRGSTVLSVYSIPGQHLRIRKQDKDKTITHKTNCKWES